MTDTPRSNEISPVVFMGSGGPDLTPDERIARLVKSLQNVIAEYDEFLKDEYVSRLSSLDDEIHNARTALRDMGWSDD